MYADVDITTCINILRYVGLNLIFQTIKQDIFLWLCMPMNWIMWWRLLQQLRQGFKRYKRWNLDHTNIKITVKSSYGFTAVKTFSGCLTRVLVKLRKRGKERICLGYFEIMTLNMCGCNIGGWWVVRIVIKEVRTLRMRHNMKQQIYSFNY